MTACIRVPLSLADAEAIVAACGGPDWRTSFLYGLGTVAVVVGLVLLGAWALRAWR